MVFKKNDEEVKHEAETPENIPVFLGYGPCVA